MEDQDGKVKVTFELEIVGCVRPRTRFFGYIVRGMMVEASAELADPDGSGTYTGSTRVEQGTERAVGIVVHYDGLSDVVRDFGLNRFDRRRTFHCAVPVENLYRL